MTSKESASTFSRLANRAAEFVRSLAWILNGRGQLQLIESGPVVYACVLIYGLARAVAAPAWAPRSSPDPTGFNT